MYQDMPNAKLAENYALSCMGLMISPTVRANREQALAEMEARMGRDRAAAWHALVHSEWIALTGDQMLGARSQFIFNTMLYLAPRIPLVPPSGPLPGNLAGSGMA